MNDQFNIKQLLDFTNYITYKRKNRRKRVNTV